MQGTELYLQKLDKSFKIISQTEARAMKGAVLVLQPDQLR
jgi:hypothetical protein